jgi:hypothetical protein
MFCCAEGCWEDATVPTLRPDGPPEVCEKHVIGARSWHDERKKRVEPIGAAIYARLVTERERQSGLLAVDPATLADVAIDEAVVYLDRLDARFR